MRLDKFYQSLKQQLQPHEAKWLLEDVAGISPTDIIAYPEKQVTQDHIQKILSITEQVKNGKPLSKILGVREFWGRKFKVSQDTLDPRPDTEVLIEHALNWLQNSNISNPCVLDIGTGTGCIALTLAAECPDAIVQAVDISEKALHIARDNANMLNVKVRIEEASWFPDDEEQYDLIVSNPPYIESNVIPDLDPEVKNHDPILALDGGADGLDAYKEIFSRLDQKLKPGGHAFFEIGYDQGDTVSRIAGESGLCVVGVHRDYSGNPRVVEISCGDK